MKRYLFVVLIFLIFYSNVHSDCFAIPSFLEEAKRSDIVALVELMGPIYHGYWCKVIDIIACKIDSPKYMIIWGSGRANMGFNKDPITIDNGKLQVVAVTQLKKDITYTRKTFGFELKVLKGTYTTSACGNNSIRFEDDFVYGWITQKFQGDINYKHQEKLQYDEFKKMIQLIFNQEKLE